MMRRLQFVLHSSLWVIITALAFSGDAHAYIDPGTGSYILQLVIAGLIGAAFTIKIFWKRLKIFFIYNVLKRKNRQEDRPTGEDE